MQEPSPALERFVRSGYQKLPGDKGWAEVEKGRAAFFSLHEAINQLNQIHAKMVTLVDQASYEFKSMCPQGSVQLDVEMGDGLLLMQLGLEALEKEKNVLVQMFELIQTRSVSFFSSSMSDSDLPCAPALENMTAHQCALL